MWAQVFNILIGLWLMISPGVLQFDVKATLNGHIVGPVIISIAIIALSQATRNVRYFNIIPGAWLIISPWILYYAQTDEYVIHTIAGLAVIVFSLVRGNIMRTFGGGWRSLFQQNPSHMREEQQF